MKTVGVLTSGGDSPGGPHSAENVDPYPPRAQFLPAQQIAPHRRCGRGCHLPQYRQQARSRAARPDSRKKQPRNLRGRFPGCAAGPR